MKKLVALFFVLITLPLYSSVFISGDLMGVSYFWERDIKIEAEVAFDYEGVQITIPIRYNRSGDKYLSMAESGILVSLYPFESLGLYCEASLLKLAYFWGLGAGDEKLVLLSEATLGWRFVFSSFYFSPRITYRALSSCVEEVAEKLNNLGDYKRVKIGCHIGLHI